MKGERISNSICLLFLLWKLWKADILGTRKRCPSLSKLAAYKILPSLLCSRSLCRHATLLRYKQKDRGGGGRSVTNKERMHRRLELAQVEINTQEWGKLLVSVWLYC